MKSRLKIDLGQSIFNLLLLLLTLTVSTSSDEVTPNWEDAQSSGFSDQVKPEPTKSASASDEDSIIVQTLRGKFRGRVMSFSFGTRNDGVVGAFLGIPYAEPPVRELRFRVNTKMFLVSIVLCTDRAGCGLRNGLLFVLFIGRLA